jgi:hypothetical protein
VAFKERDALEGTLHATCRSSKTEQLTQYISEKGSLKDIQNIKEQVILHLKYSLTCSILLGFACGMQLLFHSIYLPGESQM